MSIFFGGREADVAATADIGFTLAFTLIVFFVSSLLNVGAEVTTLSGLFERSLSRYRLKERKSMRKIEDEKVFEVIYFALRSFPPDSVSESSFSSP